MEWYEVLIGLGLLWFIGAQWDRGIQHRRKARQEGKEVRSLWWHARTAAKGAESKQKAKTTQRPAPPKTTDGHLLRFKYEDAQGNLSTRELSNWRDDGTYIEGFCEQAGDIRTFRRDRVVSFLEGEHLLKPAATKHVSRRRESRPKPIEILFTGFPASARQMLEDDAESYGMTVRKTVTKHLDFVCAGPNAGPTKLAKARDQSCEILSEDQFYDLVEDGVLP